VREGALRRVAVNDAVPPAAESDPGVLLGDRESIAKYLIENKDRIRSVARRKLSARTRSVFDSEEIASSVFRRMDAFVSEGRLRQCNLAEFWGLIDTMTENNAFNRTQLIERARAFVREDGPYAQELLRRFELSKDDERATDLVFRILMFLKDEKDRRILSFRLRGARHSVVAGIVGISEESSRKRWSEICKLLRESFDSGLLD
jgi:hypothetical protein